MHVCAGEIFFIGYQVDKQPPGVHYGGADKDGKLQFDVKVELKEVRTACCAPSGVMASNVLVYCVGHLERGCDCSAQCCRK